MQAFAHAPRMHAVDEIPSHQTVASLTKYVESRASRHDQMNSVTVGVEKALEQRLPLPVFVEFAEQCDRRFGPKAIQTGHRFSEPIGPAGCPAEILEICSALLFSRVRFQFILAGAASQLNSSGYGGLALILISLVLLQ